MSNEQQIAEKLKENIPQKTAVPTPPPPPPVDTTNGQATIAPVYELNELVQYKLQDFFGERYKENDEVKRQQVQFIYDEIAGIIDNRDYGFVVAKIRELERLIGTANTDNRLYRLYQWLKLDKARRGIEAEQGALSDG